MIFFRKENKFLNIFLVGIFLFLFLFFANVSAYLSSSVQFSNSSSSTTVTFDTSMCTSDQDFLIQFDPLSCSPSVVRSDLLEESDVQVYCELSAIKLNPLMDVEAIDSLSFSGDYSEGISGIAFHPAKAALGVEGDLNSPILDNIGYVVVNLKKQPNSSAMPEYVEANLTAKINYNLANSVGVGETSFYVPILDEEEWEDNKADYSFWGEKGFVKVEDIQGEIAEISIYSENEKITELTLKEGETSSVIEIPGFYCDAGAQFKLEDLDVYDSRVKLRVDSESIEVEKGATFLDDKCSVKSFSKDGLIQSATIKCQEDSGLKTFGLEIIPEIIINVAGEEKSLGVGDFLSEFTLEGVSFSSETLTINFDETKYAYLAYVGTKSGSDNKEDLFAYVLLDNEKKDSLTDEEISSAETLIENAINSGKTSAGQLSLQPLYRINFGSAIELDGNKFSIVGFSDAMDSSMTSVINEYYQGALNDFDDLYDEFTYEIYDSSTYGEEALYKKILSAVLAGQKETANKLCLEFDTAYSDSSRDLSMCEDYSLTNFGTDIIYATIGGNAIQIAFDGIYEPTYEEYGAKVVMVGPDGNKEIYLTKGDVVSLSSSSSDTFQLVSLDYDSAQIRVSLNNYGDMTNVQKQASSNVVEFSLDASKNFGKDYSFILKEINLKKSAQISVLPNIKDRNSAETNFSFKIGIEQRAFQLSPEMTESAIEELETLIGDWTNISNTIGNVSQVLKTSCFVAGVGLIAKNFISGSLTDGGLARQYVMRGDGGWYEKCSTLVANKKYSSVDSCLLDNSDSIDSDVNVLSEIITQQNSEVSKIEKSNTQSSLLGGDVVDNKAFLSDYSSSVAEDLDDLSSSNFGSLDKDEIVSVLSSSSVSKVTDTEQLTKIGIYVSALSSTTLSDDMKEIIQKRLYTELSSISESSESLLKVENWVSSMNVQSSKVTSVEVSKDAKKYVYNGLTNADLGENKISGIANDAPVALIQTLPEGKNYILALDDSTGSDLLPIATESGKKLVFDEDGNWVSEGFPSELNNIYFQKYDSASYNNKYTNAELRYYETDPYKGLPAIVPFDLDEGWYAATKQTLSTNSALTSYDDSGRVSNFYVCNVGANGLEEFQTTGDDTCLFVNTGTGMSYDNFPGLNEKDSEEIIDKAVEAIEAASKLYSSGVSGTVQILDQAVKIGSPATTVSQFECQDIMSPKECLLLFNLCDPVICPSSRCDFGGTYPVTSVQQSGIIGSLLLCLPNVREGIIVPVCLTGLKTGIDGFLSVLTSARDCLQENLDSGETVGICDEVYSVYLCDFFWSQTVPLAETFAPKLISSLLGQSVRGGGEYSSIQSAWSNAESAMDYFTNYYGTTAVTAFSAGVTELVQAEVCKTFVSSTAVDSVDLITSVSSLESPVQFMGNFEETVLTTATVPATSHYKVYYHIYAGQDSGAYYKVYLKGGTESSYYQDTSQDILVDSGYISVGEQVDESKDFSDISGYDEMCIMVNEQEECGFGEVSTSFALDYVTDSYVASQVSETEITTTSDCVSDYSSGIIRVCATSNPGDGTDVYVNTEDARWQEVGYCDDEEMKCWLDTESVGDAIESTSIAGDALEEVSESYVESLSDSSLTSEEFSSAVSEIEEEEDLNEKLGLINILIDKISSGSNKALVVYLRGNTYLELLKLAVDENKKVSASLVEEEVEEETVESVSTNSETESVSTSTTGNVVTCANPDSVACKIYEEAKDAYDSGFDEYRTNIEIVSENEDGTLNLNREIKVDGEYTKENVPVKNYVNSKYDFVCERFVYHMMGRAGAKAIPFRTGTTEVYSDFDSTTFDSANSKYFVKVDPTKLQPGDLLMLGKWCKSQQHVGIFSHYDSEDSNKFYYYGDSGIWNDYTIQDDWTLTKQRPVSLGDSEVVSEDYYYSIYFAMRYIGDLSEEEQAEARANEYEREKEYATTAEAIGGVSEFVGMSMNYDVTKEKYVAFIYQLAWDGILKKAECVTYSGVKVNEEFGYLESSNPDDAKSPEALKTFLENKQKGLVKMSEVIYNSAINLKSVSATAADFVANVLIDAGIEGIVDDQDLIGENAQVTSFSTPTKISEILSQNPDFEKVDTKYLGKGDIVFIAKGCLLNYSVGVFEGFEDDNTKVAFYANLRGKEGTASKQVANFVSSISDSPYVYKAYRYIADLKEADKDSADESLELEEIMEEIYSRIENAKEDSDLSYDTNEEFLSRLVFEESLDYEECVEMRDSGFFSSPKDLNWLKDVFDEIYRNVVGKDYGEYESTDTRKYY